MRKTRPIVALLTAALLADVSEAQQAEVQRPSYRAARAAQPPVIDGDLSDPVWQLAEEITGFTQMDPEEGQPAKDDTRLRVVYDEEAIYFGLTMEDADGPTPLLARRDSDLNNGDYVRISIDSQHDRINGAAFVVNASNVQMDMILFNDIYNDTSWDAVWESAVSLMESGWTAEVRIPYSQLRFPDRDVHTWGFNISRWNAGSRETTRLVYTPKDESGFVSRFADLHGIEGIRPPRRLELMPYAVARNDIRTGIGNPLIPDSETGLDGGLDVKYGLTSSLTLTGTINPDFGQVEVDPAVLNLSQFETFFPERRPFFTEGADIFRFGDGPANSRWGFNMSFPTFFYSRRIGRSPQGFFVSDYADAPGETTILGAAKLTGKVGNGWTIGVLDALTDEERGTFATFEDNPDGTRTLSEWGRQVEPMTNYLVARAMKEYGADSRVGLMFTATNRDLSGELESSLRSSAYFAGVDGYTLFRDKSWIFEWQTGSSLVEGSEEAIAATQKNAARYFHRPDADHVSFDPTRTSLNGWMARTMLSKQAGKWRPNIQVQALSPGFELNDVGFLPRVDAISTHAVLHYLDTDPKKYTREVSSWVGKFQNYNFDGDMTNNGIAMSTFVQFRNYWWSELWSGWRDDFVDDQRTRSGPAVIGPGSHYLGSSFGNDSRKALYFDAFVEMVEANDGGDQRWVGATVTYRPTPAIRLSVSPRYGRVTTGTQYVTTIADGSWEPTFGSRYIFAAIDQEQVDVGLRTEWTMSPRLSFQLYLQPFVASGDYRDFKQLTRPRDDEYFAVEEPFDPDFNFRSLRGSAVARWEFRPGSALYAVWNENRSDVAPIGDFSFRRDLEALPDAPSQDVFLLKVSYWIPM